MKNVFLLLLTLCVLSCKKSPVYGPFNLKNGQQVELLVDHRYASDKDILLKLPEKQDAESYLQGFDEREPGYNYRVKAIFRHLENPPQDAASAYFEFKNVMSKEQYKGNESFDVQLIVSYIPGGPVIRLNKEGNAYYLIPGKLQLTFNNATVENQLAEIWKNKLEMLTSSLYNPIPKWKAIKATVIHDPNKFGKAYLIQQIQFSN
jgi:hypothetical protein